MTDKNRIDAFELNDIGYAADKKLKEIANYPYGRMVKVTLSGGDTLSKHRSAEPISVLCLSGTGYFKAGDGLENVQPLKAGTLITLDANVEHEVTADPDLSLLVTKFKQY